MSATTERMWREAGGLGGAGPSSPSYDGERYLASSTLPLPSGVRRITMSARTPSSPFMRSTEPPSTDVSPSNSSPSATKNALAAARSSTTMPMCSRRWTVTNGLWPAPAARGGRSSLRHQDLRQGSASEALLLDDVELQVLIQLDEWAVARADRN